MKFTNEGKVFLLGFKYGNPVLEKLIEDKKDVFSLLGKTPWDLTKQELMKVLGVKKLPDPKNTTCFLRGEDGTVILQGESHLHPEDVFDIEKARKKALKRVTEQLPSLENKAWRTDIWNAYLNRKTKK